MEETQSLNFVEPEASLWKFLPNITIEDMLLNKVYVKQKLSPVMNILRMQLILTNAPITFMEVTPNRISQSPGVCRGQTGSRNAEQRGCVHGERHIL